MIPATRIPPACATPEVIAAARAHALAEWPREAVGAVTPAGYVALPNRSAEPEQRFRVVDQDLAGLEILALIHSHTAGQAQPSSADMAQQIAMALPWGIILTDGEVAADPFWFGDQCAPAALEGRLFRSGVTDCFALVRDWWAVERGVVIPDVPRDWGWWVSDGAPARDLIGSNAARCGFSLVGRGPEVEIQAGDVLALRNAGVAVPYHTGVAIGDGLMLHHFHGRLSRPDVLAPWLRSHPLVFRHHG